AGRPTSTAGRHRRPSPPAGPRRHLALPLALLLGVTATAFSVAGEHTQAADATTTAQRIHQTETEARAALVRSHQRASRAQQRAVLATAQAVTQAQVADRIAAVRDDLTADAQKDAAATAATAAAKIRELQRPKFVLPVSPSRYHLTASFGESSGLWASHHTGQDFAAPIGTPVVAVEDGTIVSAGWDGPYGRKLVIRADDGTETWYCHLSAFVKTSGPVKAGTLIAKVGNTGNTTGPHLHLEVRVNGEPIDPMPWLRDRGLKP
ncbi:MAG: M23 family metallopeptidase, partial [Actinomycetes bacterium]